MDKLLGYLATIGETTQEGMSSVGTGLNAIFSRMGNIKLARLKDYQNKKIGTKLIEQMINDCRKNNVSSITLEVKKVIIMLFTYMKK